VTVKFFLHLHGDNITLNKEVDIDISRDPFVLKGKEWKMVGTLSWKTMVYKWSSTLKLDWKQGMVMVTKPKNYASDLL
jgi:hypothetical protein